MSDEMPKKDYSDADDHSELGSKAAGTGFAISGTIGSIVGVIAAIGTSVVIPGLGLIHWLQNFATRKMQNRKITRVCDKTKLVCLCVQA